MRIDRCSDLRASSEVFTFGQKKADSLKEGPLMMKFKMRGEFKLSEGLGPSKEDAAVSLSLTK